MNGLLIAALATCAALTGALPAWLTTDPIVVLCIPLATCAAIVAMSALDKAAARRRKAAALAARPAPEWAISLLVDADEKSAVMRPIVQAFGPQLPSAITVSLTVADELGISRMTTEREFLDPQTKSDFVLGTLTLPDGVPIAAAALWDWAVVVRDEGRAIARRRGPLSASGLVNDEGELQAPDMEPVPDDAPPPAPAPIPVRHLRLTIGLAGVACGVTIGGYLLTTLTPWLWFAAVPLFAVASVLLVAAAWLLYAPCPLCGRPTTVMGRSGAQRCDACSGQFTLTPL